MKENKITFGISKIGKGYAKHLAAQNIKTNGYQLNLKLVSSSFPRGKQLISRYMDENIDFADLDNLKANLVASFFRNHPHYTEENTEVVM